MYRWPKPHVIYVAHSVYLDLIGLFAVVVSNLIELLLLLFVFVFFIYSFVVVVVVVWGECFLLLLWGTWGGGGYFVVVGVVCFGSIVCCSFVLVV